MAENEHADNVVVGAGRLHVKIGSADERYVGDTVSATLAVEPQRLTVFAGDGARTDKRLADVLTQVSRTLDITLRDMSMANIALFVGGSELADEDVPAALKADGDHAPASGKKWKAVKAATKAVEGAVRYEEQAVNGAGRHIYVTKARLVPSGEWDLKSREQEQRFQLSAEITGDVYVYEEADA